MTLVACVKSPAGLGLASDSRIGVYRGDPGAERGSPTAARCTPVIHPHHHDLHIASAGLLPARQRRP